MSLLILLWSLLVLCARAYLDAEYSIMEKVPKVELHAHLHGSIRMRTLTELSAAKGIPLNLASELNLESCFQLFAAVHKIVSSIDVVERILREVLEDYMAENTIYLELRTTPRSLSDGTSVEQYVESLVDLIQKHNIQNGDKMLVKLILSIDRSSRFHDAVTVSELAGDYRFLSNSTDYPVKTIVGLDFSGNPYGGRFEDFSPLFDTARDRGLGTTVHTAEVSELSNSVDHRTDMDDTESIMSFRPDRLGHVLHLQKTHLDQMLKLHKKGQAVPIEICPTSNLITLGHDSYDDHPFLSQWLAVDYPISINTDDRGIFNTSLTLELLRVKDDLGVGLADLVQIMGNSIQHSFATPEEKLHLHGKFWSQVRRLVESSQAEGREVDLIKASPVALPTSQKNVKDMQDMAYLLYI